MNTIFITGTAGSGKSLLTSKLLQWYNDRNSFSISLNLDPGTLDLPYEPDVDVRNYIDINTLMSSYQLGLNGALIMASDMIATRLEEIQDEINSLNAEYVLVDTPGQIELFAFRESGPYFVSHFQSDNKATLFIFDGMLVSSPINYVSISLLASSIKLRLKTPQIGVLTKRDLIIDKLPEVLGWSSSRALLESALNSEKDSEYSLLCKDLVRSLSRSGFMEGILAISSLTMNGIITLSAALSRILNQGEEPNG
ncbi:MAG: ATP/GTP-binding protein [Nitrososphaeraceae archaeon]|jgi:GPN-loop GTPase|nr:ATP/GTP-binding protein [Nitrososphaeraceae archaeon]MDW0332227.1 ATP/GTP-binding protein [Nitrososphaeraceae archaeon]